MTQGSKDRDKDRDGFDRIRARPPAPGAPEGEQGEAASLEEQAAAVVEADLATLLENATRERDEYLDMSRRVQADFENYKKRMLREQTSMLERAGESVVSALLPVLDAFDLARAHLGEDAQASPEGKALVQAAALLSDTLAKEGLERIDAVGAPFDPTVHEAVEHLPAEEEAGVPGGPGAGAGEAGGATAAPEPVVVGELRAGYRWKGRVIRPSMVRVRG